MKDKNGIVLIVDDEPDLLDALEILLSIHFREIRKAPNGRVAFNMQKANPADVILSDLLMPEMQGPELLRALREAGDESPFIVLTGHATLDAAAKAVHYGAFDFLLKPFDNNKLVSTLQEAYTISVLMKCAEADVWDLIQSGKLPSGLSVSNFMAAKHAAYIKRLRKDSENEGKSKTA